MFHMLGRYILYLLMHRTHTIHFVLLFVLVTNYFETIQTRVYYVFVIKTNNTIRKNSENRRQTGAEPAVLPGFRPYNFF